MTTKESTALALMPKSFDESRALANSLSESALIPTAMRNKPADVLVTIMAGQEMGLPPMASLRAFHVIEGKPVPTADGMVAIALGSGKCAYFERVEESDTAVTYETLRVGAQQPRRCTWTIEMAKKAGLHLKDTWRLYPRSMLASRAKAELARDVYPDVLMGCHIEDEIDSTNRPAFVAMTPTQKEVIEDAEIVETAPELLAIDAAKTPQELMGLLKQLTAMPAGPAKKAAREKYGAKMKAFEEAPPVEVVAAPPTDAKPANDPAPVVEAAS